MRTVKQVFICRHFIGKFAKAFTYQDHLICKTIEISKDNPYHNGLGRVHTSH